MKILIILSTLLMSQFVSAQIDRKGNGGDDVKIDIATVQNIILLRSGDWTTLQKKNVPVELLKEKIRIVSAKKEGIEIQDTVSLEDGIPRSAINFPELNKIIISRSFWTAIGDDKIRKIGILLHEYLGLLGIEKTDDYAVSSLVSNELLTNRGLIDVNILPIRSSLMGKWVATSYECASRPLRSLRVNMNAAFDISETSIAVEVFGSSYKGNFWTLQGNILSAAMVSGFMNFQIDQENENELSWTIRGESAGDVCEYSAPLTFHFERFNPGRELESTMGEHGILRKKDGSLYYMHRCEAMGQKLGCWHNYDSGVYAGCPSGTHVPTRDEFERALPNLRSILGEDKYWTSTDYLPNYKDSYGDHYYYLENGPLFYYGKEDHLGTYLDTTGWLSAKFYPGFINIGGTVNGGQKWKFAVMCMKDSR